RDQFEVHRALKPAHDVASRLTRRGRSPLAPHPTGSRPPPRPGALPAIPGYEGVGELGRGGQGVIYQAWQIGLSRLVAIKLMHSGSQTEAEVRARFRVECEAAARLQHPHIVQIYEVGECEGRPYFAMEFVAGSSLAQRLDGKPQAARDAAGLVETLA